jgi:hypothetical protein
LGVAGIGVTIAADNALIIPRIGHVIGPILLALSGTVLLIFSVSRSLKEIESTQQKIERVEERAREHPDQPQFAWDLARTKLENYLDRNLGQLRSIFWLTLLVMLAGFAFVLYGLKEATDNPANIAVSIIGSASGVIISFIGGSFLLVYNSVMGQSRRYVSVLERINAVGMAFQVLGSISEGNKNCGIRRLHRWRNS